MRRWSLVLAGLAAGVMLTATIVVTAAPKGILRPARIGVINFDRLVQDALQMKEAQTDFKKTQETLNKEAEARVAEIETLRRKLAMHQEGSPAWKTTREEAEKKVLDNETWYKMKMRSVLDQRKRILQDFYNDVEKATADYARENGLTLVVKADHLDAGDESAEDFRLRVALKKVIYAADDVDITTDILAVLDARHRRGKGAGR